MIGVDGGGFPFAITYSDEFTVAVGAPYRLLFDTFLGNTLGGEIFASNPLVGVGDRGGNVVDTISQGTVTISLSKSPTGNEVLRPTEATVEKFVNGIAEFSGLYIKEAGSPYQLMFTTNLVSMHVVSIDAPNILLKHFLDQRISNLFNHV